MRKLGFNLILLYLKSRKVHIRSYWKWKNMIVISKRPPTQHIYIFSLFNVQYNNLNYFFKKEEAESKKENILFWWNFCSITAFTTLRIKGWWHSLEKINKRIWILDQKINYYYTYEGAEGKKHFSRHFHEISVMLWLIRETLMVCHDFPCKMMPVLIKLARSKEMPLKSHVSPKFMFFSN